jgi:hypothetical protein
MIVLVKCESHLLSDISWPKCHQEAEFDGPWPFDSYGLCYQHLTALADAIRKREVREYKDYLDQQYFQAVRDRR